MSLDLATFDFGREAAEYERKHLAEYFFKSEHFGRILSGRKSIVIGPKGSGKTALAVMFVQSPAKDLIHLDVSPNLDTWARLKADLPHSDVQLKKTAWLLSFLHSITDYCRSLGRVKQAVKEVDAKLAKIGLASDGERWQITRLSTALRIEDLVEIPGVEAQRARRPSEAIYHGQIVQVLADCFRTVDAAMIASESSDEIRLVVDGFDVFWEGSEQDESTVNGLLLAAQDLFLLTDKIRPVVFIRADIWSRLVSDNKDHLPTHVEHLLWRDQELKELLRLRIAARWTGPEDDPQVATPESAMALVFESHVRVAKFGRETSYREAWAFIRRLIPARPRDLILLCDTALEKRRDKTSKIDEAALLEAEKAYSQKRYNNITKSESGKTAVELKETIELLRGRRPHIRWSELQPLLSPDPVKARAMLNDLLEYEVCGLLRPDGQVHYYSDNPNMLRFRIYPDSKVVVHPGLRFELEIKPRYPIEES